MNWFPAAKEPALSKFHVEPSDQAIRCPECSNDGPFVTLVVAGSYVWRDGLIVAIPDGFRLACQHCPCVFSLSRHGVFRHHPDATPPDLVPRLRPPIPEAKEAEVDFQSAPVARRRPVVP